VIGSTTLLGEIQASESPLFRLLIVVGGIRARLHNLNHFSSVFYEFPVIEACATATTRDVNSVILRVPS